MEMYKGITIRQYKYKFVGLKNRKWFASATTKEMLYFSIDSMLKNMECSKSINITRHTKSTNPNVR